MSPIRHFLIPIAGAAILCVSAFGDTIILKSGEKVEGKVISETPSELTVEVKISAGVTDLTKIPKDTVEKIEKEKLDEVAWQSLKNVKLGANSLPPAQYEVVVRPLQNFVTEYPDSSHKGEAEKIIAEFAEEKKRVDAGEVRMGQKWLSKEEVEKERYQINATLAYQYMRGQVTAGDLVGALNSFTQIEKNFNGARAYPDAVETAKAALGGLKTVVDRAQQTYKLQQAEFETGVRNAVEPQKSELIAARKRESAQGEAAIAAADRAGLKWPPLIPRSDKSIAALAQKIPNETQKLTTIEVAKMRESIKLADAAAKQIADKKADAADESLRNAAQLWNANEIVKRLQPEVAALRATASAPVQPEPVPELKKPEVPEVKSPSTSDEPIEVQVEEKPFFLTPGGIITAIVLIALLVAGLTAYKKIRGKASDVLE